MSEKRRVSFLASFPPIKSALIVGQDGMQIKLEIPESEMASAVPLLAMRGAVLRVTVEVVPQNNRPNEQPVQTGDFKMKG